MPDEPLREPPKGRRLDAGEAARGLRLAESGLEPTRAEAFERLGFSFCKIATVALLTGPYCLTVASGLCAGFFLLAHLGGKRDTRCLLRHPLLAAALYGAVCVGSVWYRLHR